jgi:hypothetical protein
MPTEAGTAQSQEAPGGCGPGNLGGVLVIRSQLTSGDTLVNVGQDAGDQGQDRLGAQTPPRRRRADRRSRTRNSVWPP